MKRVLIIGGAGYIGSHVVLDFIEAGWAVTVFDNLSSGTRENLMPGAAFIHGDILHCHDLRNAMARGYDAVIHLAAYKAAGESMLKPEKYSVNNITGTLNILNAMCETGLGAIIFSSSAAVYGEPEYTPLDEEHPTKPENYYGFTKLEIERFLQWYSRLKGLRYAALRYFNAAGYDTLGRITGLEQNPANLLPVIMEAAAGLRAGLKVFGTDYPTEDGTCIRDYIHVSDLASAHRLAAETLLAGDAREGGDGNITVNLGTGEGLSVLEILESSRAITGRAIPAEMAERRPGDPAVLYAKAERAFAVLGWEPCFSDRDTIVASTWEVYRSRGSAGGKS